MKKIAARPVTCDVKNKDMYGRAVSVCYVDGGPGRGREDLNAWLVAQGDAVAYAQYSKDYVPLEQQAKADRKVRVERMHAQHALRTCAGASRRAIGCTRHEVCG